MSVNTLDPVPTTPSGLAHLMWELEQNTEPSEPDPCNSLWDRLLAQEGHDVAAPLWSAACSYYDHDFASDDTED